MAFEIIDSYVVFGSWPITRAEMPAARLSAILSQNGVSQGFAISTLGLLHNHNDGNAETLRICASDNRLTAVATIDPRGYFGNEGYVEKLVAQGFKMFRFFPVLQDWTPVHSAFEDVLEELNATGVPIMFESKTSGYATYLSRLAEGKKNAYILEGIKYENMSEIISVMKKHDNIYVNTRGLKLPTALKVLVDQVGDDRIIFASGTLMESLAASISYILSAEISDAAKEKIFSANAKRVMGGL